MYYMGVQIPEGNRQFLERGNGAEQCNVYGECGID